MLNNVANTADPTRFDFGMNWLSFIDFVDEARIRAARDSLPGTLQLSALSGRTFLAIGCGSGLFSLAADQLGAHVCSFDHDQGSVFATTELRRRFAADSDWRIDRGLILDPEFVAGLGRFDVVYS
jgi:ribosomal protein L11 methylase PrmA